MSNIFKYVASGFQYGCVLYYSPRKYRPFYVYKKQGNNIEGEFNIGENIILDWNGSEINLLKDKLSIQPLTYSKDSFMTTATYLPTDTGVYLLKISHLIDDPITNKQKIIDKIKTIYVKAK